MGPAEDEPARGADGSHESSADRRLTKHRLHHRAR